jgi:hypothetical protein
VRFSGYVGAAAAEEAVDSGIRVTRRVDGPVAVATELLSHNSEE